MSGDISYFGETDWRQTHRRFGIRQRDRLMHQWVIGQTGVGKSTLLETLAISDLAAGRGFALIDPHGDMAERIAAAGGSDRILYLDATDLNQPFGYNPLRRVKEERIPLAAGGFLETLRKLWPQAWGVRMEHVLRNSLLALMERDDSRLPDILQLYANDDYRRHVAWNVRNPIVRQFWLTEFEGYDRRQRAEMVAPIQNKLGALLSDPRLHRILVEPPIELRFRKMMDEGQVLLVNLSKGEIGEDACLVLGSLLVSTIGLAAYSRADIDPADRQPFFLYVDEFQNFATLSFVNMLAELRKGGVGMVLANQHLHQLEPDIRHAVLGNAGTLVSFRVGAEDAPLMSREFQPIFDEEDLINLPNHHFYLRLMIDGTPSRPFSARTIRPPPLH